MKEGGMILWASINQQKLPKGEVLAGNFKKGTDGYREVMIGYIRRYGPDRVVCENANEILEGCTHYVDVHKNSPTS